MLFRDRSTLIFCVHFCVTSRGREQEETGAHAGRPAATPRGRGRVLPHTARRVTPPEILRDDVRTMWRVHGAARHRCHRRPRGGIEVCGGVLLQCGCVGWCKRACVRQSHTHVLHYRRTGGKWCRKKTGDKKFRGVAPTWNMYLTVHVHIVCPCIVHILASIKQSVNGIFPRSMNTWWKTR